MVKEAREARHHRIDTDDREMFSPVGRDVVPLDRKGQLSGCIGNFEDLTKELRLLKKPNQVLTEERLRNLEKLCASADRSLENAQAILREISSPSLAKEKSHVLRTLYRVLRKLHSELSESQALPASYAELLHHSLLAIATTSDDTEIFIRKFL